MKKYQQLVLTILAITGTIFFIFYKHEYNRLRAVLQVLDTFGEENGVPGPGKTCKITASSQQTCLSDLPPTWTQIGNLYFLTASIYQSSVEVLSAGVSFSEVRKCLVWSEMDENPTNSDISVEYIVGDGSSSHKNSLAIIKCVPETSVTNIYGVTLSVEFQGSTYRHFVPAVRKREDKNEKKIAICTLLNAKPYRNKLEIAEFIEYHRLFGASHFYLYNNAIGPSVLEFLDEFQGKVKVSVVHWTLPVTHAMTSEVEKMIFLNDCLMRSRGSANYVAILNVSQILIPRFHEKLQNIIEDIEEIDSKSRAYLQFYAKTFCLDYANDPHAELPLKTLQKTWWQKLETEIKYSLINNEITHYISSDFSIIYDSKFRGYSVPSDVAVIHKYEKCENGQSVLTHESVAHKFAKNLLRDELIKSALKNNKKI